MATYANIQPSELGLTVLEVNTYEFIKSQEYQLDSEILFVGESEILGKAGSVGDPYQPELQHRVPLLLYLR